MFPRRPPNTETMGERSADRNPPDCLCNSAFFLFKGVFVAASERMWRLLRLRDFKWCGFRGICPDRIFLQQSQMHFIRSFLQVFIICFLTFGDDLCSALSKV